MFISLLSMRFLVLTIKGPFEQTPKYTQERFYIFFVFRAIIKISTLQHYDGAIVLLVFEVVTSTVRRFLRKNIFILKKLLLLFF